MKRRGFRLGLVHRVSFVLWYLYHRRYLGVGSCKSVVVVNVRVVVTTVVLMVPVSRHFVFC